MNEIIDWKKLQTREGDRLEFEKFCFHVASCKFEGAGVVSYFYNTPGSEFYIDLNNVFEYEGIKLNPGDIVGWQAKFWKGSRDDNNSPLDANHKKELIKGFKTTKAYRPNIKLWVICTPGSFVQKEWDKLETKLKHIDPNCLFVCWHKDIFEDFYLKNLELYNRIYQFYFGEKLIDKSILIECSRDTLFALKAKFDVDVHTPSDFEKSIVDLIDISSAEQKLKEFIKFLKEHADDDRKTPILDVNSWGYNLLSDEFSKEYIEDCDTRYNLIDLLYTQYYNDKAILSKLNEIHHILSEYFVKRSTRVLHLNKELDLMLSKKEKSDYYFNEYLTDLSQRISLLESKLKDNSEGTTKNLSQIISILTQKIFHIFAAAGYGKTHLACSLAERLISKNTPVLLLTGGKFRNYQNCELRIKECLNLPANMSFDDVLDSLDFLAETCKSKLAIIIDGLNETAPNESRWKDELPALCRKIANRKNIILITTCRDKSDYTEAIFDRKQYQDVDGSILINGIQKEDVEVTLKKYLRKYNIKNAKISNVSVFENPLLLKIFCIVNKNKENIEVNEYSLASCMEEYSKQLLESITTTNGHSNRIEKHKLEKNLCKISFLIWEKNNRQLSFYDEFAEEIDNEVIIERIIEEGLCFTMDRSLGEVTIQFTYDMVAGYHIAKSFLDKNETIPEFNAFIERSFEKLFGEKKHTLSEDILKSLLYLIPKKYDEEWIEICHSEDVLKASFDNLDILMSSPSSREALTNILSTFEMKEGFVDYVCKSINKRINTGNIEYFLLFIPFFERMTRRQLDVYWNSKYATYPELQNVYSIIHDKFLSEQFNQKDKFCFATMMCGITDKEFRQKFYWYIGRLALNAPQTYFILCRNLININDPFIREIVISVITGLGLRLNEKKIFLICVYLLETLLINSESTNVVLLDNLETLYSYGEDRYSLNFDRMILYKNSDTKWPFKKNTTLSMYSFFDYDFDKFNIRPLYEFGYDRTPIYSKNEVYGMLENKILTNGYEAEVYRELNNKEYENIKYRREYKCNYSFKYGRDALLEMIGWLLLNHKIENEFKGTFRTDIISIDPSFPFFNVKRTLISKFLLPISIDNLESWIDSSDLNEIKNMTITKLPGRSGEWILLRGYFSQRMEDRFANIYLSSISQFVLKTTKIEELEHYDDDEISYSHAFASELGWRDLEFTKNDINDNTCIPLLSQYSFSSWSQERFKYQSFSCLETKITKDLGLVFDMEKMRYLLDGNEVSAYYINDSDFFFYLRRDVVDKILKLYNVKLRFHFYERRMIDNGVSSTVYAGENKFKQLEDDSFYE